MNIDDNIHAPCEIKETEDLCPYLEIKSCMKCYEIEKAKVIPEVKEAGDVEIRISNRMG
uniref:Uncharacterized protein n=1 Tax=viral metagenome TaxID=1070528 RepID=A0A6M3JGD5_9ZZZZ